MTALRELVSVNYSSVHILMIACQMPGASFLLPMSSIITLHLRSILYYCVPNLQ